MSFNEVMWVQICIYDLSRGCEMIMELCQILINNVEKSKKNLRAFKRNQAIDKIIDKIIWIKISFSVNFI